MAFSFNSYPALGVKTPDIAGVLAAGDRRRFNLGQLALGKERNQMGLARLGMDQDRLSMDQEKFDLEKADTARATENRQKAGAQSRIDLEGADHYGNQSASQMYGDGDRHVREKILQERTSNYRCNERATSVRGNEQGQDGHRDPGDFLCHRHSQINQSQ